MYKNLKEYISVLERTGELIRVKEFVDTRLQISEITDRISKSTAGGKAILFENTGTQFPVLTNMMGSDKRIALALGVTDLSELTTRLDRLFGALTSPKQNIYDKLKMLPLLGEMSRWMPRKGRGRGACQQVVLEGAAVDLSLLPILQCWPSDGGRFVTLPLVNTKDPETGIRNVGMYRMQVFSPNTTGLHWHRHKTGERHYQGYKKRGERMPVSVCLGGDPAYTYAATAPLPDNVDEYLLAGFLREKPVELVRCLTNDLEVPADCDFVIEGYVDPTQEKVVEGPFGDHTGFYSLEDYYPVFHVTCITHRKKAIYPATLVGIPPQEDAYMAKATEKIFLAPIRLAAQPEIRDMFLPEEGVAHNIAIINIDKSYPAQGLKVASSMWGAGQMMFNKFMFITSTNGDIHQTGILKEQLKNVAIPRDVLFSKGPLDVLDHAASVMGFGGKMCIDATEKLPEEHLGLLDETVPKEPLGASAGALSVELAEDYQRSPGIVDVNPSLLFEGWQTLLVKTDNQTDNCLELMQAFLDKHSFRGVKFVLVLGREVDLTHLSQVFWLAGNNIDPARDVYVHTNMLILDARAKTNGLNGFSRRWPNVVTMDTETIKEIDKKWSTLLPEVNFIISHSLRYRELLFSDGCSVEVER